MNQSIKLLIQMYQWDLRIVFGNMIWDPYIVSKNINLIDLMLAMMRMWRLAQFKYLFVSLLSSNWVNCSNKEIK